MQELGYTEGTLAAVIPAAGSPQDGGAEAGAGNTDAGNTDAEAPAAPVTPGGGGGRGGRSGRGGRGGGRQANMSAVETHSPLREKPQTARMSARR